MGRCVDSRVVGGIDKEGSSARNAGVGRRFGVVQERKEGPLGIVVNLDAVSNFSEAAWGGFNDVFEPLHLNL